MVEDTNDITPDFGISSFVYNLTENAAAGTVLPQTLLATVYTCLYLKASATRCQKKSQLEARYFCVCGEEYTQTVQRKFRTGSDVIPVQTGSTLNVLGLTLLLYLIILCVHSVLFTEVLF